MSSGLKIPRQRKIFCKDDAPRTKIEGKVQYIGFRIQTWFERVSQESTSLYWAWDIALHSALRAMLIKQGQLFYGWPRSSWIISLYLLVFSTEYENRYQSTNELIFFHGDVIRDIGEKGLHVVDASVDVTLNAFHLFLAHWKPVGLVKRKVIFNDAQRFISP